MDREAAFIDHGIAAVSEEQRTAAVCRAKNGDPYFVICSRGFILSTHLDSGRMNQAFFPEGLVDYPFASLCSSRGLVYTGAGRMFMEYDPVSSTFTFHACPDPGEEIIGFRFAEDGNGGIYFATYPSCCLLRYDPDSREIINYGPMDDTQKYVYSMAADREGWVYLGIGTEKRGITAFCPSTGEKRQLVKEEKRLRGSGHVHLGRDGNVYGNDEGLRLQRGSTASWVRLWGGNAVEVGSSEVSPDMYFGEGFGIIHSPFFGKPLIKAFDLPERELEYENPVTGQLRKLTLEYKTEGASLSPIVAGPDGIIYGTTNHPFQFFSYDQQKDEMTNRGGRLFGRSLGNICAYTVQGSIIGGAAYAGGFICMYDTKKIIGTAKKGTNPSIVAIHEEICRPRCAVSHPDGKHMIFGGFGGYGVVGGGLCIYNTETGEDTLIENGDLLPYHSTLCMQVLSNGDLICGTSIETPGGARPRAKEGEIYLLDWRTRKVAYHLVPVAGAREVSLMEADDKGLLHCITSGSVYFVFDPESQKVLKRMDLSAYGGVVRNGLAKGRGGKIYGLLGKALYVIDPETGSVDLLAETPAAATSGIAIAGDRLYFGSNRHLWSFRLP